MTCRTAIGLAAAMLMVSVCLAAERVQFTDGREIEVRSLVIRGGWAHIELPAGGTLAVPADRIAGRVAIAAAPVHEERAVERDELEAAIDPRWTEVAGPFAELLAETADRYGIERALLAAMMKTESAFDPFAVSNRGACGLLQLMPGTAKRFETADVFDPKQNIDGGARYFRWLLDRFDGRIDLALAGYNAGEGAVDRFRAIPPYRETLTYVVRVLDEAHEIRRKTR